MAEIEATEEWNVIDRDANGKPIRWADIAGHYIEEDSTEDEDYPGLVAVIASVAMHDKGGFTWNVEDNYVGYVDGDWVDTELEAKQAALKCVDEWCADESQAE